jgi:hypothetical protein
LAPSARPRCSPVQMMTRPCHLVLAVLRPSISFCAAWMDLSFPSISMA